jgi:hypothetical protein
MRWAVNLIHEILLESEILQEFWKIKNSFVSLKNIVIQLGTNILPEFGKLQEKQKTKYLNRFPLVSNQKLNVSNNQRLPSLHHSQ